MQGVTWIGFGWLLGSPGAAMLDEGDFGVRVVRAWLYFQARAGRQVTQREVGRRVAELMGRRRPHNPATVSAWFKGTAPDAETITALARALDVDPGWLAFGAASQAPAPPDPVAMKMTPLPRPEMRRARGNGGDEVG